MSDQISEFIIHTQFAGIPIIITAKTQEEQTQASVYLLLFVFSLLIPISAILQHQYIVISSFFSNHPLQIPGLMFFLFTYFMSTAFGTGLFFILFFGQLATLFLR